MALKKEVATFTPEEAKLSEIAKQKLKLMKGGLDYTPGSYTDPGLKQSLLAPVFNPETGKFDKPSAFKGFFEAVEKGQAKPTEAEFTKYNLQQQGITDFNLTEQEKALIAKHSKISPEDYEPYTDLISEFKDTGYTFQFGETGKTYDSITGQIYGESGKPITGAFGGQEKQYPAGELKIAGGLGEDPLIWVQKGVNQLQMKKSAAQAQGLTEIPTPEKGAPLTTQTDLQTKVTQQAQQLGNKIMANKEYVNAVFKAFHGRDANAQELKEFTGKGVQDVLNAIKAGAPKVAPPSPTAPVTPVTPAPVMPTTEMPYDLSKGQLPTIATGDAGDFQTFIAQQQQQQQKFYEDLFGKISEQEKSFLEAYKSQPSLVDELKKLREEQGLPQLEKEVNLIDKQILDTEGLLDKLEADITARTKGFPVSESARRRMLAIEGKSIEDTLTDLVRARTRLAGGLETKEKIVAEILGLTQQERAEELKMEELKMGFGKEKLGMLTDIFAGQQGAMLEAYKVDKEALKEQLKTAKPDYEFEFYQDNAGNVSMIQVDKKTGETETKNIGNIAKTAETISSADTQMISADMQTIQDFDGYYDTAKFKQIRENVAKQTPKLLDWFDKTYEPEKVLNPNSPTAKSYIQGFKQEKDLLTILNDYKTDEYSRKDIEKLVKSQYNFIPTIVKKWLDNNF